MKKKTIGLIFLSLVLFVTMSLFVVAEEDEDDIRLLGVEVEELLNLISGVIATGLSVVTIIAYNRSKQKRLIYVAIAFALFAIKGYFSSLELFFDDWEWVDIVTGTLDFAILISFFTAVIKR